VNRLATGMLRCGGGQLTMPALGQAADL
jgi:hypothetical protein